MTLSPSTAAAADRGGAAEQTGYEMPLLVKISPDMSDEDVDAVADLALELGVSGIVATNTTLRRDS